MILYISALKRIGTLAVLILLLIFLFQFLSPQKDESEIFFWLESEVLELDEVIPDNTEEEIIEFLKHGYRFKPPLIVYDDYFLNNPKIDGSKIICEMIKISIWDYTEEYLEFFLTKKNEFVCAHDLDYISNRSKTSYQHLNRLSPSEAFNLIVHDEGYGKYSPYKYPKILFLVIKNNELFTKKQKEKIIKFNETLMSCVERCPEQFSAASLVRIVVGDEQPRKELIKSYKSLYNNISNKLYVVSEEKLKLVGLISSLLYHSGEKGKAMDLIELVLEKLANVKGTKEYALKLSKFSAAFFSLYIPRATEIIQED
jgi:hypothetical protein